MFSKNLKYYRLKQNMTKKQLASLVNVTPMAITHYENGQRTPDMTILKKLANALQIRISDFLNDRNDQLQFTHKEFRRHNKLSKEQQEYIRESVEEYISRFYNIIDILGKNVLPSPLVINKIEFTDDIDADALRLRKYLGIAEFGPVGNLIELLENKGMIVQLLDIDNYHFSGMNGFVNDRPYIIINKNMSPERIRTTIVHELAHLLFEWDESLDEKEHEDKATAIAGAFLLLKEDAIRELGIKRTRISKDMEYICKEYGISMYLLVKRAQICHIINDKIAKDFYINANKLGWKKNEPHRISYEEPYLFKQLVFRAVCEHEISIQKGAELLQLPYEDVYHECFEEV